MTEEKGEYCGKCKYFFWNLSEGGDCRYGAPEVDRDDRNNAVWPRVRYYFWCGRYERWDYEGREREEAGF